MNAVKIWALAFVVQGLGVAMFWRVSESPCAVTTLNLGPIYAEYQRTLVDESLTVDQQHQRWTHFHTILNRVVGDYQRDHHTLILRPSAVMAGAEDITLPVQRAVEQALDTETAP
ncbi:MULTISPECIES: TrbI F-type domain-containing protein [Vibrio]|uniref:TrbI F-type domain-containing protein n=1 Tax=Vibrio TaxID=662 RepID=UPI0001B93F99|nr:MULTISPECIES: TrbI F-type domain-containing protein [Vibrio]EEX34489.1 hypothetical protein VIC_001289 [Vibrio coralliilyticus ATCC BAA-450]MDE3898526.1 TrbI F-type domain-containing protein [Vibrio sp. CC007]